MPDPEKQPWLYHETGEASYRASQFMAIEGQTFVLVASQILTEENLEKNNLLGNHVTKTVGFQHHSRLHTRRLELSVLVACSQKEILPPPPQKETPFSQPGQVVQISGMQVRNAFTIV